MIFYSYFVDPLKQNSQCGGKVTIVTYLFI